ncbi:MAG: ABC transporter permease [Acetobacteraceae bacterium]|nr:ABC transporter permease [Acetobacteraceae bacterium]
MLAYALRRTLVAFGLIWVVVTLVFLALHMVPGDPAELLLSGGGGVAPDPATIAEYRDRLGLDRPLIAQYLDFLHQLTRLDLGTSFQDDNSVAEEVWRRLPRTLELILAAGVISLLVGVPAGALAAVGAGGPFDRVASAVAAFFLSVPVFVTGTVIILVFAQTLRLTSAGGYVPLAQDPLRHLGLLMMPATAIAVGLASTVFRIARTSVAETLARDWVRTARAKGLTEPRVVRRHVVRNAASPVLTVFALHLGALLGGTVLIEYVFNWPGLSSFLVRAVEARDYPEVRGIVLVISTLFVFLNLAVDLLYAALDPRVRHG